MVESCSCLKVEVFSTQQETSTFNGLEALLLRCGVCEHTLYFSDWTLTPHVVASPSDALLSPLNLQQHRSTTASMLDPTSLSHLFFLLSCVCS
jgi:hypothetical protein